MQLEFCGEWFTLDEAEPFTIGREGDLEIDDNPYLHRRFLRLVHRDGLWWLENVGSRISATVADPGGNVQAWVAPGARLPLVFARTTVLFTAGPTTYELTIAGEEPAYDSTASDEIEVGETTIGPVALTPTQRALVVSLAEPVLRGRGSTASIPTSAQAAARLGWNLTRFNRKLDNVCEKLSRTGVRGLRGGPRRLAVNRRARLVEHAVASRLVTADDLPILDEEAERAGV
ncbi:conserved hypothetical protein [Beutenbergia cavernae DSM 12333]|uniref:FHA domain-containing protein n=1 Tax=Beutenbergia cavernae (strain ATCC BAA-8 / DSM 12333 / CCUG 43141 / JCM 11478 / NBRC 16432 / NCIMB 13614 / HKI 0122) TaxID=471853 RepID=C5C4N6_BEUC1|nr:conserved hypothetical protein [Beutenbergia cavernae DSM 12333]